MRQLAWAGSARTDYLLLLGRIAADDRDAAERLAEGIETMADALAAAASGHRGRVPGTYEKSARHPRFTLAYALTDEATVTILRVVPE
ncbi:MAG: type II toxin-antitoxin system RelE/ParE family toxin [Sphingomonadales bacterium]|nr:type II toxin-antitoxin system RelE/ParE family toxin [Sphingomonadales bacterium]